MGAEKTHWTSLPKREHSCILADGQLLMWEETLELVGSIVSLDRNTRHAMAHRMAQANKCQSKMAQCPSLLLDSETGATEHCEKDHVASVLVERKHVEDAQSTERQKLRAGVRGLLRM